jgi:hypothetical protein
MRDRDPPDSCNSLIEVACAGLWLVRSRASNAEETPADRLLLRPPLVLLNPAGITLSHSTPIVR